MCFYQKIRIRICYCCESGFAIVVVYVVDLNLVGTPKELTKTANCLKNEFEMKDLSKTKFLSWPANWTSSK